ncbi:MAG: MFS transporter [Desulfovibrio sp.]|jgi:MFS family permease|nr:MFS transporter [Desulfovibrio sp.]
MANVTPLWTRDFCGIFSAQSLVVGVHFGTMITMPMFLNGKWGLEGAVLGMTISVYLATAIVIRPCTGFVVDRIGRKAVYFPSYILYAALFFLYPLMETVFAIVLLRVAHGVLWASVMCGASTLAVDLIPANRRGEGIGIYGLSFNIGQALGSGTSVLLVECFGFDGLYIANGILMALGSILVGRLHAPPVPLESKPFTLVGLLEKTSVPASLVGGLIAVPFGGVINYSAYYAVTTLSASPGVFFLCLAGGMAFSRLFIGKFFDRSGPEKPMGLAFFFLLLSLALKGFTRLDFPFYLSGLFIGLGCGITIPLCQAMVNSLVPPQRRGGANATFLTAQDIGIFIGVLVIGWMQKDLGWEACHCLETCLVLLAALIFKAYTLPHYQKLPKMSAAVELQAHH